MASRVCSLYNFVCALLIGKHLYGHLFGQIYICMSTHLEICISIVRLTMLIKFASGVAFIGRPCADDRGTIGFAEQLH